MQFFNRTLSDETRKRKTELREMIQDEDDSKILNVNKEEYLDYITEKYKIQLPEVNMDDAHIGEKGGKICVYIPYAGDTTNLKFRPSHSTRSYSYSPSIFIQDENIEFQTRVNGEDSKQKIEQVFNTITGNFRENYNNLKKEVKSFNEELKNYAEKRFDKQKEEVKEKKEKFADLDVPLENIWNRSDHFDRGDKEIIDFYERVRSNHFELYDDFDTTILEVENDNGNLEEAYQNILSFSYEEILDNQEVTM